MLCKMYIIIKTNKYNSASQYIQEVERRKKQFTNFVVMNKSIYNISKGIGMFNYKAHPCISATQHWCTQF